MDPRLIEAAKAELERRDLLDRFDAYRAGSRPTEFQRSVIEDFGKIQYQYIVAGNRSGKSQLGAFVTKNMWSGKWPKPERWGTSPVQIMVLARTMKIAEEVLWPKIQGFFKPEEYKVVRQGMVIQKVIHKETGNVLLFQSHHATNEARQKIQAFELCGLWLDEEPGDIILVEEAQRRLQDKKGFFFATFTSKSKNVKLQKLVDACDGTLAKRYKLKMLDNPIYSEQDKVDILKSIEHLPRSMQMCILEGDWMSEESAVYHLNHNFVCRDLPATYSTGWTHVEGADPAMSSKHGCVVFAQDPDTGFWYIMRSTTFQNVASPEDMVLTVTNSLKDLNIVRRVADAASDWYIKQARKMGFNYTTAINKNNRKEEMMKNLQLRLGKDIFVTEDGMEFLNELQEMQWAEGERERIINDKKYHLHYAGLYASDRLPKVVIPPVPYDWNKMVHEKLNGTFKQESKKPVSVVKQRILSYGRWRGK